jgi:hypothetical protein
LDGKLTPVSEFLHDVGALLFEHRNRIAAEGHALWWVFIAIACDTACHGFPSLWPWFAKRVGNIHCLLHELGTAVGW